MSVQEMDESEEICDSVSSLVDVMDDQKLGSVDIRLKSMSMQSKSGSELVGSEVIARLESNDLSIGSAEERLESNSFSEKSIVDIEDQLSATLVCSDDIADLNVGSAEELFSDT